MIQQTNFGGGGWADPNASNFYTGGQFSGNNDANPFGNGWLGSCNVNCTNLTRFGFYSFHTGMAQSLMGDGSVRVVNQNISDYTLSYLISRQGGDTPGDF